MINALAGVALCRVLVIASIQGVHGGGPKDGELGEGEASCWVDGRGHPGGDRGGGGVNGG